MDALQEAWAAATTGKTKGDTSEALVWFAQAQAYAAIAQVEATREQTAEINRVGDEIAKAIRDNNQYN